MKYDLATLLGMALGVVFIFAVWMIESWRASSRLMRQVRRNESEINTALVVAASAVVIYLIAKAAMDAQAKGSAPAKKYKTITVFPLEQKRLN
jgi:hypothetical protein